MDLDKKLAFVLIFYLSFSLDKGMTTRKDHERVAPNSKHRVNSTSFDIFHPGIPSCNQRLGESETPLMETGYNENESLLGDEHQLVGNVEFHLEIDLQET